MSSNGQTQTTSPVATNDGKVVQVADLVVNANRIYGFVQRYKAEYFEDHGLDWCLDEILTRGMAEITRQVKTARERAKEKAAGSLLKEFNMTPAEAKKKLLEFLALERAQASAKTS
jgi:hypothetical protein